MKAKPFRMMLVRSVRIELTWIAPLVPKTNRGSSPCCELLIYQQLTKDDNMNNSTTQHTTATKTATTEGIQPMTAQDKQALKWTLLVVGIQLAAAVYFLSR